MTFYQIGYHQFEAAVLNQESLLYCNSSLSCLNPCLGWDKNNYVWTFVKKGGTRICNAYEMTYELESRSVDLLYFSQCKNRSTTNNNT